MVQLLFGRKQQMVDRDAALPGRSDAVEIADKNVVLGHTMVGPFDPSLRAVILGGGCFWGIEEIYWQVPGVFTTAVGYAGGYTPNATYEEVCSAKTGHTEAVLVVFDPAVIDLEGVLKIFWESHDPTQEMRQGNDIGTQYRSAIYLLDPADVDVVRASATKFESALHAAKLGDVATEISALADAGDGHFYYAEDYHQQYLYKNPNGYRCHAATGLKYPA